MSQEARYYRVGAFVLSGMALILIFIIALGGQSFFVTPTMMETYFNESVQGLEVGSPVKVSGVQIGRVAEIGLASRYYDMPTFEDRLQHGQDVIVVMEVVGPGGQGVDQQAIKELQTMIDRGLRLRIASQGITGISYIQAQFLSPDDHPQMQISWTPKRLYIPSAPSTMATISTAAERIASRLEDVEIQELAQHLDDLIVTVTQSVRDLQTGSIRRDASAALDQFTATLSDVEQAIDSGRYDFELALENLRVASENLRDLSETARSYPSVLLLGDEPSKPDVSTR